MLLPDQMSMAVIATDTDLCITALTVHRAVSRALAAIADDLATERQISPARTTPPRVFLERFDQVVDAVASGIDPLVTTGRAGRARR